MASAQTPVCDSGRKAVGFGLVDRPIEQRRS